MARKKKISDPLARVMRKVAEGKKLSKHDREILSAVRDAMNLAPNSKKDPLARAMSKVAKGERLTASDKLAISGAIDAVRSHDEKLKKKRAKKKTSRRKKK